MSFVNICCYFHHYFNTNFHFH